MHNTHLLLVVILFCLLLNLNKSSASEELDNYSGYRIMRRIYDLCSPKDEMFKCFKIQALKVADRALHSKTLDIYGGIKIINDERKARTLTGRSIPLNETKLQKLENEEIDELLTDTTTRFLDTHKIQINVPELIEEGRKKKGKGNGALLWALAIKGSFLAMAYKGIAIMAGTALIVGKMALLLSAILGLKKLVSSGHEKTTFEIVKHPKYSESHSHSTSYEDDGHYHRSYDVVTPDSSDRHETIYRAYIHQK